MIRYQLCRYCGQTIERPRQWCDITWGYDHPCEPGDALYDRPNVPEWVRRARAATLPVRADWGGAR